MPSGYEKSDDYGGKPPRYPRVILALAVIIAFVWVFGLLIQAARQ